MSAPNLFRTEYRPLSVFEKSTIDLIKQYAQDLVELYAESGKTPSREMALAVTKLEESVMWAVKGITG